MRKEDRQDIDRIKETVAHAGSGYTCVLAGIFFSEIFFVRRKIVLI